jgi:hypothetical protein
VFMRPTNARAVEVVHRGEATNKYNEKRDWNYRENVPRTPVLNDAGQQGLLRVVGDVRAQPVNNPTKVAVCAASDAGNSHVRFQRREDFVQRRVE